MIILNPTKILLLSLFLFLLSTTSTITTAESSSPKSPREAILPRSSLKDGRVRAHHDHNLVLIHGEWEIIDFEKQYKKGRPPKPIDEKWKRDDTTILVLIASLREGRLKDTLVSLFTNATFPDRVYVGIVQQNADQDLDIVEEYCSAMKTPVEKIILTSSNDEDDPIHNVEFKPISSPCIRMNQIRVYRMAAKNAQGPAYARALGAKLVDTTKDEYCMQIDAHTKVAKGWDKLILAEWGATENEFAVLSTYPTNVHDLGINTGKHWEMPHLCCASAHNGIVVNCQAKAVANLDRPVLAPLWAAGLSFSRCHAEREVPNDINLLGVFAGEEYGRGVRLWTHGYDFYSITRPIVGTYYGGEKGGKGDMWHTKQADYERSAKRLGTLTQWEKADLSPQALEELGFYGLGRRRTLDQYIEFSGINPKNGDTKNPICAVSYVPWSKSSLEEYQQSLTAIISSNNNIKGATTTTTTSITSKQQQNNNNNNGIDVVHVIRDVAIVEETKKTIQPSIFVNNFLGARERFMLARSTTLSSSSHPSILPLFIPIIFIFGIIFVILTTRRRRSSNKTINQQHHHHNINNNNNNMNGSNLGGGGGLGKRHLVVV
jgi:hypothetical protein